MHDIQSHIQQKKLTLQRLEEIRENTIIEASLSGKLSELFELKKNTRQAQKELNELIHKYRQMRKIKINRDTLLDSDNVLALAIVYGSEFVRDTAHELAFKYAPNVKDIKYPESMVSKMSDSEYEQNREAILNEMKLFRPEAENLTVERTIHRDSQQFSYSPQRAEMLKGLIGAEGVLAEMGLEGYEKFDHKLLSSINPQIKRNVQSVTGDNKAGSMKNMVDEEIKKTG
jgi:hypothetical protein